MVVSIRDADGDSEEFRLEVVGWENPATGGKPMRPRIKTPEGTLKDVPEAKKIREPALAR